MLTTNECRCTIGVILAAAVALVGCNDPDTDEPQRQSDTATITDTGPADGVTGDEDADSDGDAGDASDTTGEDTVADTMVEDSGDTTEPGPDTEAGPDTLPGDTGPAPDASACRGVGHGTPAQIASTPRSNTSLEMLALTLTQDVVAPQSIYDRVTRDVPKVKKQNSSLSNITHRPRHNGKSLLMQTTGQTAQEIKNGTYTDWDCLNQHYVDQSHDVLNFTNAVKLELKGRYDLSIVGSDYAALPGIKNAGPNQFGGDGSTICADRNGDTYHYVFVEGWGDCPSGCIHHNYWYYTVDASGQVTKKGAAMDPAQAPSWANICGP
jgi:hypothetical protein